MPLWLLACLAFSPVLATGVLMAGFNWPAKKAMPVEWLGAAVLGLFVCAEDGTGARCRSYSRGCSQCL